MQIISTSFRFWKNSRISLVWKSLKRWICLSVLILSGAFFNRQDIAARRSLFMPVNRSVPDVVQKRKDWNGLISGFKASDLVFLDESGCNTDMTRRYAYSLGGSRAVDSAPLSKPKNTTILSSIQLDGTLRYTTFSGGTTVERFKRYLETDLLPHLNGNSVLIMDNMKSHHAKAAKICWTARGFDTSIFHRIVLIWILLKNFGRRWSLSFVNSRRGRWMPFQMRFRMLSTLWLFLIVPAGSASADMRFNFENCYNSQCFGRF